MRSYRYVHLSNDELLRQLNAAVAQERVSTATLVSLIAEVDSRRLYANAGYSSMHTYCVDELHLSDDEAFKRIRAARAGRRFPVLFDKLATGQVHLTAVYLIAPYLTAENADKLIRLVTGKRKREVEELVMRRFPSREPASWVRPIVVMAPRTVSGPQLAPEPVADAKPSGSGAEELALEPPDNQKLGRSSESQLAPEPVGTERPARSGPAPAAVMKRYLLHFTIAESTHEKLRHVQALLSHAVPSGDVAQVFERALDALRTDLEKRKFGAAGCQSGGVREIPAAKRTSMRKRYIPVVVRNAVWKRDQGQCTFVSANGTRCNARRLLEFDHIEPVARGGTATVAGIRLRCRTHNQLEAERMFGEGFMDAKRRESRIRGVRRGHPSRQHPGEGSSGH